MQHLRILVAAPALAVALAFAVPALAQQAAGVPSGGGAQATSQRMVSARNLMTPEERLSFRGQMQQATPQDRQLLWEQKRAELQERATLRGMAVAEPGPRLGQGLNENESRRAGREFGRSEGSPMRGRMMGAAPHGL